MVISVVLLHRYGLILRRIPRWALIHLKEGLPQSAFDDAAPAAAIAAGQISVQNASTAGSSTADDHPIDTSLAVGVGLW